MLSLTACGGKDTEETVENAEVVTDTTVEDTIEVENVADETTDTSVEEETENVETEEPVANEVEQENSATEESTPSSTPQTKPEENTQAPSNTEEQKPAEDTKEEVVDKEEEVKEETSDASLGQTLLSVFKANSDSMGTQELADKLITNEAILFMGGAMPVEPGLLSGFDNAEITGFKEGTMFAPMMGSIAFVGYVFELEDGADVEAFKQTLKDSANPRWQICVAAEETIVESVGNKVFFLMCPTSLEQ